jgi:hypothetical protein
MLANLSDTIEKRWKTRRDTGKESMTTSNNKPTELSDTTGGTNAPRPVPASSAAEKAKKGKFPIKPVLFGVTGVVASAAAVVVYRKLNKPVPKSEQIARKVRKYVKYLEKQNFEFPELPPQFRKTVEKKSRFLAETAHKLSKHVAGTVETQWHKKFPA